MSHEHGLHQSIGFMELWRPEIMLLTILIGVIYFLAIGSFRHRFKESRPVSKGQKSLFTLGLFIFYIALGSPLSFYGHHYLFSAHMLQMALLYLVWPPIILLGIPDWLIRPALSHYVNKRIFLFLTKPIIAILLFNVLFSLYHLPPIFDTLMANHSAHFMYHSLLGLGAILMWWPLLDILPEDNRLSGLRKIAYIFGSGVLLTPVCALIVFATTPIFETYLNAPQIIGILPTLDDQQLGGVLMKVIQELTYMTAITIIFFKWAKQEKAKDSVPDPLID
jgi:putative membrane protein